MIIKECEYKECPTCKSRKLISDEEYGCDNCKKPINPTENDTYLKVTAYHHNDDCKRYHFCSWKCVFATLKTIKTDYFISLPYLSFDMENKEMGVDAFWKAVYHCVE